MIGLLLFLGFSVALTVVVVLLIQANNNGHVEFRELTDEEIAAIMSTVNMD